MFRNSKSRKQKSKILKKRRFSTERLQFFIKRAAFTCAILLLGGWLISWAVLSGAVSKTLLGAQVLIHQQTASLGFKVENLLVEGRVYTDPEVVRLITNIERGQPIFAFDTTEIHEKLMQISWIDSVKVTRRLPDTIHIALQEKQPLALVKQKGSRLFLVDRNGEIITKTPDKRFEDFIIVSGEGAVMPAVDFLPLLFAEKTLAEHIYMVVRKGERRWQLVTKQKTKIELPEHNVPLALTKLSKIHNTQNILDQNLTEIDLRNDGKVIVMKGKNTKPQTLNTQNLKTEVGL